MKYRNQNGLTLLGFLIVLVVALFFAYIAMRIIPLYLEYHALINAMDQLENTPGSAQKSPARIKQQLINSLWVSYSTDNIKKKHIRITRKDGVQVRVAYEVRRPMLGNVDVILSFDRSVTLMR
jgi:hypothetical protein